MRASPLVKFAELVTPSSSPIPGSTEDRVCWDLSLSRQLLHLLPVKSQERSRLLAVNVRLKAWRAGRGNRTKLG
jgi:hypothetical protein